MKRKQEVHSDMQANRRERIRKKQRKRLLIIGGIALFMGVIIGGVGGKLTATRTSNDKITELTDALSEAELQVESLLELQSEEVEVEVEIPDVQSEIDVDSWELRLVNRYNLLSEDEEFDLTEIENGYYVDSRIMEPLQDMLEACRADGIDIYVRSAYREWETQELYFNNKMQIGIDSNMSYYDAYMYVTEYTALPGASEHQLGLALDLISTEYETLDAGQADTDVAKWLLEHSCEYGFILRFPEGKEDITGVEYEPWHYRYVGIDAATEIMEQGITLEEYLGEA